MDDEREAACGSAFVSMSDWYQFKNGESIGQTGSEGGKILRDEEHTVGARVTLEDVRSTRFTITCGIYGWMVHTRFFESEAAAQIGFDETKDELTKIVALIPLEDEANDKNMRAAENAIEDFVERCQ
jgi:hypothetical protein